MKDVPIKPLYRIVVFPSTEWSSGNKFVQIDRPKFLLQDPFRRCVTPVQGSCPFMFLYVSAATMKKAFELVQPAENKFPATVAGLARVRAKLNGCHSRYG